MSTRMTAQRLARLIAAHDAAGVTDAVTTQPQLLAATVERNGQDGWTPLHVALAHAPGLVPLLRELGTPVDAASAAYLGDVSLLTGALDGGAPADPVLLRCAAAGGSVATVRVLLDRGVRPDGGALHAAASAGAAPVVELLLQNGADVDGQDRDTGRTPLHTAVAAIGAGPADGAADVVHLLLDAGADVNATTHDGASALDIARVADARRLAAAAGQTPGQTPGGPPGGPSGEAPEGDPLSRLLVAAGATH